MSQPAQEQEAPGVQSQMIPVPDCGEQPCVGHGRLANKAAVITGGDSGIGRAVSIAFAREGPMYSLPISTSMTMHATPLTW